MKDRELKHNQSTIKIRHRGLSREDISHISDMWDTFCAQGETPNISAEIVYSPDNPDGMTVIMGTSANKDVQKNTTKPQKPPIFY